MYSTSFKTPENLAVFDKWYVAYLVYLDGRWLLTRGGRTWGFFCTVNSPYDGHLWDKYYVSVLERSPSYRE